MDEEAPTGVRRRGSRRWLRRLLILLLVLPPVGFGLSNLALASPWARAWLSRKIQQRTTLETSIDGASWSPWNGVTFRGITMQQPEPLRPHVGEPLVRIQQLRVRPVWKTVFTHQPDLRDVSLISPRVVLPLEILSHFAAQEAPTVAMTPPAPQTLPSHPAADLLAEHTPADNASPITPGSPPPTPSPAAGDAPPKPADTTTAANPPAAALPVSPPPSPAAPRTDEPSPPTAAASPQPAQPTAPQEPTPTVPAKPPSFPTDYIHLEDASITLLLAGTGTNVLETSGITGKIPVAGDPGKSTLTIGSMLALGSTVLENRKLDLTWKSPLITVTPFEEEPWGFKARFTCQLAMLPGIPIAFMATAPGQPVESLTLPGGAVFKTPGASADFRFRAHLLFPATWEAAFSTQTEKPTVTADGQVTKFDEAKSMTVLRGGALSVVDARIVGDQLSMLGNATIFSNGSTAGVLRIVAPPETTIGIVNRFFPGLQAPPAFSSMSTPQRAALDIEASGSLGDIQIRLGKNGPLAGQPNPPATATPP